MKISTFTTMTNPESRNDPWEEALLCYHSFSDEVIITGEDWPYEFKFDQIGKFFQQGFDLSGGDWVFRMDIDYFFHEKSIKNIRNKISKFNEYPAIFFHENYNSLHQIDTKLKQG